MKKSFRRIVCFVLCICLAATTLTVVALTQAEQDSLKNDIANLKAEANGIQAEINKLKAEKADQQVILNAIRKKINNTQQQIDRCNQEISRINGIIAENNAKIKAKEAEMEDDILAFKKRLRAIYMSGSNSNLQILLGDEDFSDFLQLAQLSSAISSHDKRLIEDIKVEIEVLNEIIAENEKLLAEQVEIKKIIDEQQKELETQEAEAEKIYNDIVKEQANQQADLDDVNAEIKKLQKKLEDDIAKKQYASFINPSTGMQWPVSGYYTISAHFKSNDAVHKGRHNGMDIAGSGIAGQPIRAAADGYVDLVHNGCKHNYKKYGNCCGNGYGNYCVVNHGSLKINGSTSNYVAYYAHASQIIVKQGQYVKQGQILGYVGTTGWSTGYHLHFGVLKNGSWINPYPLFF